ncbi:MAG: hypothetical protein M5U07_04685 [Xanthobacteraceae bacterium]|nr:hypothetical protein [Xanthobacteraceae bacterium]
MLPKLLLGGFAVFIALGSFWGMIWFVRSLAEPPRVAVLKPALLASSESRPVPPAPAEPAPAEPAPAKPAQAAAAAPARPTDGLAERWSPIEAMRPAAAAEPPRPKARPVEAPKPVVTAGMAPLAPAAPAAPRRCPLPLRSSRSPLLHRRPPQRSRRRPPWPACRARGRGRAG